MSPKNLLTTAIAAACAASAWCANASTTQATLQSATVFTLGAELHHQTALALKRGDNEVRIEGLSPFIDQNSLKISLSNGVVVSAYEFSVDYLTADKSDRSTLLLQDSLEICQQQLANAKAERISYDNMLTMLQKGIEHSLSVERQNVTTETVDKNLTYYQQKAAALQKQKTLADKKIADLQKQEKYLQAQLRQDATQNARQSGVVALTLNAPLACTAQMQISYYTPSAQWTPCYDINISSTDKPIDLHMKAHVSQTTGMDWEGVKLTLATGTPNRNRTAPVFSTWFLRQQVMYAAPQAKMMMNAVSYDSEKLDMVATRSASPIRGINSLAESKEPMYIVNGEIVDAATANSLSENDIASRESLDSEAATQLYGSSASAGVIIITTKSMEDYILLSDKQLNREFAIELPYSVPGNGKEQTVPLQKQQIKNATYTYYCAPKLDSETFLIAEVADWEKLNLLDGKANITYDGTYCGTTQISSTTNQKLSLTLGSDPQVSVKREKMTEYSNVKTIGSDTRVTLAYKTTVRNNKNKAIKLTLKEQYPISTSKDINVEVLKDQTTSWTTNRSDLGVITWEETLQPGQSKEYIITYTAKYPKGWRINLQ